MNDIKILKNKKGFLMWLFTGCFLVFAMVVIGGITRLTESGLSITEWKVMSGTIPPLNQQDWELQFQKYQQSPEFIQKNFNMTLSDFKFIFFWEYIHRLIGRIIGIVFLFPFLFFYLTRQLDKALTLKLLGVFLLGGFQGFLGWYMVKSGLVDRPDVSHYRLAMHLVTAFITCAYIFWIALSVVYPKTELIPVSKSSRKLTISILILTTLQILYGAFVAGLNAGKIYNTFPLMGDSFMPEAVTAMNPWWKNLAENMAGVQFIHRYIAYILFGLVYYIYFKSKKTETSRLFLRSSYWMFILVNIQFLLGLLTLLYAVPVCLGVLHQTGAFLLFLSAIFATYTSREKILAT